MSDGEWGAGGGEDDEQSASERAQQRAEAMVADELAAYRLAERRLAVARDGLHSALGRAMEAGHTPYRLAQVTGLSQAWIGRLRTRTHSPESRVERQD